jgi:CheY-like chemotaxis protein
MDIKKIVVIEDEIYMCDVIERILKPLANVRLFLAHDGITGRQLCMDILPDLIFLDFIMPKENGDKVMEYLKKTKETRKIPVVVMSGLAEHTEDNIEEGIFYLPKPFKKQMLLEMVEKFIGKA